MPKMPEMPKRLKTPTIFEMQTDEFNHERLFYHNGRGQKRWAAVVPPRGLQLKKELERAVPLEAV